MGGELPSVLRSNDDFSWSELSAGGKAVGYRTAGRCALDQDAYAPEVGRCGSLILNLDELVALSPRNLPVVVDLCNAKKPWHRPCRRRCGSWGSGCRWRSWGRPRRRGRCLIGCAHSACRYVHPIPCAIWDPRPADGVFSDSVVDLDDNLAVAVEQAEFAAPRDREDRGDLFDDQEVPRINLVYRKQVRSIARVASRIEGPTGECHRHRANIVKLNVACLFNTLAGNYLVEHDVAALVVRTLGKRGRWRRCGSWGWFGGGRRHW